MNDDVLRALLKVRADVTGLIVTVAHEVALSSGQPYEEIVATVEGHSAAALSQALEAVEDACPTLAARLDDRPLVADGV